MFNPSGPTISHHLKVPRDAGLIAGEGRGTWVCCRVRLETLGRPPAELIGGTVGAVPA